MKNIATDIKKHYLIVEVTCNNTYTFLRRTNKLNIQLEVLKYATDKIIIKVLSSDYTKLKKEFFFDNFKIISDLGIYKIRPFFRKNYLIVGAFLFGFVLLYYLTTIITSVEVIHESKEIRNLLYRELEERGIKKYSYKKTYKELQEIKKHILEEYPENLEWIEIESEGMKYIVRVEERIINKPDLKKEYCHVISKKDGIITKIVAKNGETIKRIDQYVKKDEVIISGEIKLNEVVKNNVCAEGDIYAEVWYIVNVQVPMNYEEKINTGKKRYNIYYDSPKVSKTIFRSRLEHSNNEDRKIFTLFATDFFIRTEYEYELVRKKYTEEEAINKGINLAIEKAQVKLNANEYIIENNVLKKSLNDSTMVLEIFLSVNELISMQIEYVPAIPEIVE